MTHCITITTTIPFVNNRPHVGFALELVQADVLARYYRLCGRQVRLQTGTDENAFKNVLAAREQGLPTQALVDRNAALFLDLAGALNIGFDHFVRTSEAPHIAGAQRLWQDLRPGDLYRQSYTGLYCTGCEDFYLTRDLVNGLCPDHGTAPVEVREENYFFRLSAYQEVLERVIADGRLEIVPESRRNEVLAFIRRGLTDISVSRSAERSGGWGIPVPGDASQVIYVWIDALANYLSGLGYGSGEGWREYWNEDTVKVHVIGKNVWKFHAVYWPALLLSAGRRTVNVVMSHPFCKTV